MLLIRLSVMRFHVSSCRFRRPYAELLRCRYLLPIRFADSTAVCSCSLSRPLILISPLSCAARSCSALPVTARIVSAAFPLSPYRSAQTAASPAAAPHTAAAKPPSPHFFASFSVSSTKNCQASALSAASAPAHSPPSSSHMTADSFLTLPEAPPVAAALLHICLAGSLPPAWKAKYRLPTSISSRA